MIMFKGFLLGSGFGVLSIFLFWRLIIAKFAPTGAPIVVGYRPWAMSFFGGVVVGLGAIVAVVLLGLWLVGQHGLQNASR
jgi:hypothetical protein